MPDFQYIALGVAGNRVTGVLRADTRRDVLRTLGEKSLHPVDLRERAEPRARRAGVPARLRAGLYDQLGDLLSSGVPLLKALDVLARQSSHAGLKRTLEELHRDVAEGRPLHQSMRARPETFPDLVVCLVQAGEEGGFLEDSLRRVATITERQDELRGKVAGALSYPVFLLITGVVVLIGMMVFFVPQFEPLFDRLRSRGALPWPTVWLLAAGHLVRVGWWAIPLIGGALAAVGMALNATPNWALRRDRLRLKLPLLGPITRDLALSRFCRILGTLLANGVPMLRALSISAGAAGNKALELSIRDAAQHVSAGKSLAGPLGRSGLLPAETLEMIAVGETSNRLETVLVELADKLDRRTQRSLEALVKLLEPCLMLVMATLVGFLVVALLLPVFEGSSGLG